MLSGPWTDGAGHNGMGVGCLPTPALLCGHAAERNSSSRSRMTRAPVSTCCSQGLCASGPRRRIGHRSLGLAEDPAQARPVGVVSISLKPALKPRNEFTLECDARDDNCLHEQLDRVERVPGADGHVDVIAFSRSEVIVYEFGQLPG